MVLLSFLCHALLAIRRMKILGLLCPCKDCLSVEILLIYRTGACHGWPQMRTHLIWGQVYTQVCHLFCAAHPASFLSCHEILISLRSPREPDEVQLVHLLSLIPSHYDLFFTKIERLSTCSVSHAGSTTKITHGENGSRIYHTCFGSGWASILPLSDGVSTVPESR